MNTTQGRFSMACADTHNSRCAHEQVHKELNAQHKPIITNRHHNKQRHIDTMAHRCTVYPQTHLQPLVLALQIHEVSEATATTLTTATQSHSAAHRQHGKARHRAQGTHRHRQKAQGTAQAQASGTGRRAQDSTARRTTTGNNRCSACVCAR